MTLSRNRLIAVVLAVALLITVAAAIAIRASSSAAGVAGETFGPAAARIYADQFAATLPLPKGGNLNGIRWEEAGGGFSRADIAFVARYNAACQWYRALNDGRQVDQAKAVIAAIPQWDGFAGTEVGQVAQQIADEVASGQPGVVFRTVLGECISGHERELAYTRSRGQTPSA